MLRFKGLGSTNLFHSSHSICSTQVRFVTWESSGRKRKYFKDTRLPPRIKKRVAPNPNKNQVGVFHSGKRLAVTSSSYYYRYPDVANSSPYDPPMLFHDYIYDTSDFILEPFRGGKGIVMNRPHTLNAYDSHIISMLEPLVQKYSHQPLTSFVTFLKGHGSAFSSGTNFSEIYENLATPEGEEKVYKYFRQLYKMVHNVHNSDTVVMPVMDGLTLGSAASFSVNCIATAATPQTDIAWPETGFGFHPDAGATFILSTLPSGIGEWLALTGSRLTGQSVVKAGLATHFYTEEMVQVIQEEMDQSPFKSKEHAWRLLDWADNSTHEPFTLLPYLSTMEKCFTKPTVPEIMQALADEATPWSLAQLEKLKKKSPLSLVITLQAIQNVTKNNLSIDNVLQQDFRLTRRLLKSSDFISGVDTLIVKKKGTPKWTYASPLDVPAVAVEKFFAPFEDVEEELVLRGINRKTGMQEQLSKLEELYNQTVSGKPSIRKSKTLYKPVADLSDPVLNYYDEGILPPTPQEIVAPVNYPHFDSDTDAEVSTALSQVKEINSPLFQGAMARDATQILAEMERIDPETVWANEQLVEPTGKWDTPNFVDSLYLLLERLELSSVDQPRVDSVTQGRVAEQVNTDGAGLESQVETEQEEVDLAHEFGFSDDDLLQSDNEQILSTLPPIDATDIDSEPELNWSNKFSLESDNDYQLVSESE